MSVIASASAPFSETFRQRKNGTRDDREGEKTLCAAENSVNNCAFRQKVLHLEQRYDRTGRDFG